MFSEDGTKVSDSMMTIVKNHFSNAKRNADSIVQNRPQKIQHRDNNKAIDSNYENKQSIQHKQKFLFTVINVNEPIEIGTDYKEYSQRQIVSGIKEIYNYNEDKKAMFEDEIIQDYSMRAFSGNVVSKKTYVFDNYTSASQERNTFLIKNP